ncbi:NlpC/P60 family protein [Kitasatospora sp. NPDC049258]|uniref:C40 family peptidase n=1 Tax=Kitasatospora sp. NPDC049258 TaxID=3155394 RepID=UPI00342613E6
MGSHRKQRPPSRARLAVLTTAAAGTAALSAAPAAQAAPKPDLATVQAQLDRLNEEAEVATEHFDGAEARHQQLQGETTRLQQRLAEGQEQLNALAERLGTVAAAEYRAGGIDPGIALMLDSDPAGYLRRAAGQEQAAETQVGLLKDLQERRRRFDQQRAEATSALAELEQSRSAMAAERKTVQTKLAETNRLMAGLTAAERATVDAADQARAGRSSTGRDGGPTAEALAAEVPASGRAAAVLAFAKAQLGKPYRSGGTGPDVFDCSGLALRAWQAAGVSLPRVSQDQWRAGPHIARADLQPGDLVFFYNDIHHVGIYVGGGMMIHAPRAGKNVMYLAIDTMPYMGAVRPG